jgi:hypothetical protein
LWEVAESLRVHRLVDCLNFLLLVAPATLHPLSSPVRSSGLCHADAKLLLFLTESAPD